MRFSKWQALGNEYVLVEPGLEALDADRVRALSRGADGVLEVTGLGKDELELAIWNADGSRAELSGNGTRIAATWFFERTGVEHVRIRVGQREVVARQLDSGDIEQELGRVEVGDPEVIEGITVVPVSVGNPHAVVVGDPDRIAELGPLLESHTRFPQRTNVQIARIDGPGIVSARVWERGVGETRSSGTSAAAVAAATHGDGTVIVRFPGGDFRVILDAGTASLIAPAATRLDGVTTP